MSQELDNLQAAVTKIRTVKDSVVTTLKGLAAEIVRLKNDPVALQAMADSLGTDATDFADAVTASTPTP